MWNDTFRRMTGNGDDMLDASDASVLSGAAVGFDAYGCGNVSDGDDADVSMCDSWRLLHLADASDPFRRYDE